MKCFQKQNCQNLKPQTPNHSRSPFKTGFWVMCGILAFFILVAVLFIIAIVVIAGMTGTYLVCTDGVLGKFAKQIDSTLDDSETSTGSIRAVLTSAVAAPFVPGTTAAVAVVTTATINDGLPYTVCQSF